MNLMWLRLCSDVNSTVDTYISRMREIERGGVSMDGISLDFRGSFYNTKPSFDESYSR